MSTRPDGWFRFDLTLRSVSGDPDCYTKKLGISPRHAVEAGSQRGEITAKFTVWIATLHEGQGKDDDAFSDGLSIVLSSLEKRQQFLKAFSIADGQSWLTINHAIGFDSGVLSRITLEPTFLASLVECDLALTMQGWSADDWPDMEAAKAL